ncbi:MAG: protein-export chaperone SecB [Hyphomicrobiaceae bacterium]|nr:protein-export chaperone SecB [Hyphomicrobiaceae bacterium]
MAKKPKSESDTTTDKAEANGAGAVPAGEAGAPEGLAPGAQIRFSALAQFIRDLSVENPNAPESLKPKNQSPKIDLNINVSAKQMSPTDFDVTLKVEAKAGEGKDLMFAIDLDYGGLFRIENVPANQMGPFVMIEAPRFLFPFAREIIAQASRQCGFPPLMIDPVDFMALYRQRLMQQQGEAGAAPATA